MTPGAPPRWIRRSPTPSASLSRTSTARAPRSSRPAWQKRKPAWRGAEPPVMVLLASQLEAARSQMAFTLAFHIILASVGVAFPALMLIANYRGLRHEDRDALRLARRWSKVVAVTFAVGAVTGTVLSFEFGLLWPAFTGRFGEVFGVLFAIEGICFFLEAIFVAIYIFGWERLS